ncbi:membrane-associated phospholipid phosphatase [Undibacterium sp. GrIS 1.8]
MIATLKSATRSQRWCHFLANALAFLLCYQASNFYAYQENISRNIKISFETNIPFLEWMIIPYLSSGIFFLWSFVQVKTIGELRLLSQRLQLTTICATFFFVFYPLRFGFTKPEITSPHFAFLFHFLSLVDKPYNQLPSLHVAYCLIFWHSLQSSYKYTVHQFLLAACLFLVAVSTVFIYQHHILDLLGGLFLALIVLRVIKGNSAETPVAFYYAMAACIVFLIGVVIGRNWIALYLCLSLLLVGTAYFRRNRFFLRKKNGRHPLVTWLLYAPYLIGYRLTWLAVQYIERKNPAFIQFSDQLWIGRRLNQKQADLLPNIFSVVDLSPELSETNSLRRLNYLHFPLLDLMIPESKVIEDITKIINSEIAQGHSVYLHCAMGYSRCIFLANSMISESNLKRQQ